MRGSNKVFWKTVNSAEEETPAPAASDRSQWDPRHSNRQRDGCGISAQLAALARNPVEFDTTYSTGFSRVKIDSASSNCRQKMQHLEIPSFRVKRPHKKSRLGCVICKQRRVKCDEARPACKECRRRGLGCAYDERPVSSRRSLRAQSSAGTSNPSTHNSVGSEVELMQHFFAHTVESFAAASVRSEHCNLWKVVIPALAYTFLPVRHGLLTAGALCMYYDSLSEPWLARKYFEAAESNGRRFVVESRRQALRFDALEFDSILVCSRLLSVLGLAFYRSHRANGVTLRDAAAWTWLHLLRGVKTLYTAILESDAEIDPVMSINMTPEIRQNEVSRGTPTNGMQWHRMLPYFPLVQNTREERFEGLVAGLNTRKADFGKEGVKDLSSAILSLEKVTKHICIGEVHSLFRAICTWPGDISNGFMDMLLRNEPFALAVYAHWLMIVVLAKDMWWFGDMGVAGIREVVSICSDSDPGMEAILEWPKKTLDTQIIRLANALGGRV